MKNKFKIGDRVYHEYFEKSGTVKEVKERGNHVLYTVLFDNTVYDVVSYCYEEQLEVESQLSHIITSQVHEAHVAQLMIPDEILSIEEAARLYSSLEKPYATHQITAEVAYRKGAYSDAAKEHWFKQFLIEM